MKYSQSPRLGKRRWVSRFLRRMSKKGSEGGFSLIELVITVALCALVVTLMVVNVSFLNRSVIRVEVNKLYTACMYVRQCALTTHQEQTLIFNKKNNSYSFDGRVEHLSSSVTFGVIPGAKGPPSSPQKLLSSPITFKKDRIVFYPDGVISSGTVYLTDYQRQSLYALSNGIAQISYLRKYLYTGRWQLMS